MQEIQKSPRGVVHYDAIHHTNLMQGVKVNPGQHKEEGWEIIQTDNPDRYHICTICHQIAKSFFENRGEVDHIPLGFKREYILSIQSDGEFRQHAVIEFEHLKVQEEAPEFARSHHEEVNVLKDRLVAAFQESAIQTGNGRLEVAQMREIRNAVFSEFGRAERGRAPRGAPRQERPRQYNEPEFDERNGCGAGSIAFAAIVSIGLFFFGAFSDMNKPHREDKEQRTTGVRKSDLSSNIRYGRSSGIYH